ncbi:MULTISPECIES: hypothetical protein [unclassified Halomonas]|uniref:hypothetical protein n=1 Tax=unclassified Halomonas TaxID=2609666 RepID=UPI0007D9F9E4|nr:MULTISPECIES: hypothetical protein [unclassified Halomonas]MBT2785779.1 hypothetical protein [Halomonas sp. ISL-106]MBT2798833.1 hypothetical protein [Halomonas sp. ISL-104]OAL59195.1 hypothetical protein A6R74_05235 [Halomonas sp. ALS9]
MMINHSDHIFSILWSEEDQQFVGLCSQFPSLSWLANDSADALAGIQALVRETLADINQHA